jgi:hypothetical protein
LGRLARIPYFCGKEGDIRQNDQWKKIRQGRRNITPEDKDAAAQHTMSVLAGNSSQYEEPESKLHLRSVTSEWIAMIRRGYAGRIIRRTVQSQRYDGKKINDTLPPYTMIIAPVTLDEEEAVIIEEVMERISGGYAHYLS